MNRYWLWYFVGVALPYFIKLGNYLLRKTADHTVSLWRIIAEYMVGDVQVATTSVMTLGAEWVLGAIYVDKLPMPFMEVLDLPLHVASCFFLGAIAELIAPLIIRRVVGWFGPASSDEKKDKE